MQCLQSFAVLTFSAMADRRQCIAGVLIRFVLPLIITFDGAEAVCSTGMFQCNNGYCVSTYWRCDGNDACGDWSDESNCLCSSAQFTCLNGRCIKRALYCDGINDCNDNSDEISCDTTAALSSSSSTTTTTLTPTTTTTTTTTRPPAVGASTSASSMASQSLATPRGAPSILISTLRSISSSSDAISSSTAVSRLLSTDDATPKLFAGRSPNGNLDLGLIVGIVVGVGGGLILVAVAIIVCQLRCRKKAEKPNSDSKLITPTYEKLDAQQDPTYAQLNGGFENPDYRSVQLPGRDDANPTYNIIEDIPKHDYEQITYNNTLTGAKSVPQSPSESVKDTKVPIIETLSQNPPHEVQNNYVPGPVAARPKATGVNTYDDLRNSVTSTDHPHYETLETDAAPAGHDYVELIPEGQSTSA